MTKPIRLILVSLACLGAGMVVAAAPPPRKLTDKGKVTKSVERVYDVPHERPGGTYSGMTCKVRFRDRFFGYLSNDEYGRQGKEPVSMQCFDAMEANLSADAPVRFDSARNEWVRDIEKEIQRWGGRDQLDMQEVQAIKNSIRVHPLKDGNSKGYAYTVEPWTGDESARTRTLDYCLFHAAIALCGHGSVGRLQDGRKADLTPYVLDILQSVEFLTDSPVMPEAAP